ncbi:MAG: porin [Pigmentiphaga sp.]|nr:porin [Pigmentiphaga sp.]
MKKTLLAAAMLAGFAGAAQAQSSVTLYGLVDAGFNHTKVDGVKTNGIDSGLGAQSRWGIRGVEDLGNGLKALFVLESGITVDDGNNTHNGRLFGRYAYVGLESAQAGRLTLGRTTNLGFMWGAGVASPFGLSYGTASIGSTFAYNDAAFGGGRVDNSVYYYTPNFAGFQAALGYAFNAFDSGNGTQEFGDSGNNNRSIDAGLRYGNGPLDVVFTYQQVESNLPATGVAKSAILAASYDFGPAKLHAGYNRVNGLQNHFGAAGFNGSRNFTGDKDNAWTLGVSAPVGPGTVMASYQKASKSKVDGWQLGYHYDLSKRTGLYAYYADFDRRDHAAPRDFTARQFAVGLQHKF